MLDVGPLHRRLDLPRRRVASLDPDAARGDQLPRLEQAGLERLDLLEIERQLAMKVSPFGQVEADQAARAQHPQRGGHRLAVQRERGRARASASIRESHCNEA